MKSSRHYTAHPSQAYLMAFDQMYGKRPAGKQRFHRELLPEPLDFYTCHLHALIGNGKWAKALCPFHEDHNPSLSVNVETGSYRCFACNTKGGGVVDFYMQLHGVDFKTAAKALGAWRTDG